MSHYLQRRVRPGFTLTEMLVVIGIIAILAALLLPAVNRAIYTARNAAIAVEVNQLATAIESYKQDKGDYPPNFRVPADVLRHIRKCYPKIDPTYLSYFMIQAVPPSTKFIDEGESLVFWLTMTDNDPRYPFLSYPVKDANGNLYPIPTLPNPPYYNLNPKKYYDFDPTRYVNLVSGADGVPAYKAKFCKDTSYIYIDSRAYDYLTSNFQSQNNTSASLTPPVYAYADDGTTSFEGFVRPYWSGNPANPASSFTKDLTKPVNPTTFQLLCAGQDGDFGLFDGVNRTLPNGSGDTSVKLFPSGLYYTQPDKDNIANFSNGRTLADNVPP